MISEKVFLYLFSLPCVSIGRRRRKGKELFIAGAAASDGVSLVLFRFFILCLAVFQHLKSGSRLDTFCIANGKSTISHGSTTGSAITIINHDAAGNKRRQDTAKAQWECTQ